MSDYIQTERQATTAQGLDPIVNALRDAKIIFDVEQTGGMTMVVVVPVGSDVYCITLDDVVWDDSDPDCDWMRCTYAVVRYTAEGWRDGSLGSDEWLGRTVADVVTLLSAVTS